MISPTIIAIYLSRKLGEDSDFYKNLDDNAINEMVGSFKFKTKPFKHQKICFLLGTRFR
jgi:hypothetical protein